MTNKDKSKLYTLSAFLLGFLLIEKLNKDEQNSFGNWLMLVSQVLSTNGSYRFNNNQVNNEIDIQDILYKFKDSLNKVDEMIKNDKK